MFLPAEADRCRRARSRRGRLFHGARSRRWPTPRVGDTITDERKRDGRGAAGLQAKCSRSCSAACSRSTPRSSRTCARPWASCASTTPASPTRWKRQRRSASASAAASSACCTSRSSRSASSREFDLDLIATAPSVVYGLHMRDGVDDRAAQPGRHAGRRWRSSTSRSRGSRRPSSRRTNISAAS